MSTWPQCALRYDGTFAGFLTCVGESFRQKTYPFYFLPPGAEQITLYPLQEIPSDPALARAVYRALETAVSPAFRRMMTYGFLTCLPQRERSLFDLIYLAFHHALPQDPTDDRILLLTRAIGHLVREAEHYRGFVRFADYGGVLVGQIAPKNRVLPLLRPHFCQRLPEEAFLLHDETHRGSGRSARWTGWTWTAPARRRPSARPSGGSSTPPLPSPSGTTPNCSRPTCPSGSGAT